MSSIEDLAIESIFNTYLQEIMSGAPILNERFMFFRTEGITKVLFV